MTLTAVAEKLYTVEAYFELEKHSEVRHEYYYGKLIEMPGESKIANNIANNPNSNMRVANNSQRRIQRRCAES